MMTSHRDIGMLMRYTAWADRRLYSALTTLEADVLQRPRPGRAAGLMGTLDHIYAVDLIWKGHLEGHDHGLTTRALPHPLGFAELRRCQEASDAWYVQFAETLDETALGEVIDFRFVDGGPGSMRRGDILLHVAHHKTYHRGYVADMLYESGLKPPTMDLPVFLRDAPREAAGVAASSNR